MRKQNFNKRSNSTTYLETKTDGIGNLLWHAASKWRRHIENALRPLELTHTQFMILSCIDDLTNDGTDVTQGELARHSNLDATMTSQILRTLEQRGLIERRMRPGDERSKFPHLTINGQELVDQALPVIEEIDSQFFTILRSDTKKCIDILEKLTST